MMSFRSSRMVRKAVDLQKQVARLVHEQRDLLNQDAVNTMALASRELSETMRRAADDSMVEAAMANVIAVAEKSLIPYPHPTFRENIKELFVAAVLVLSISTFFVQLTKIPTGSMQPTLFGVTAADLRHRTDVELPNFLRRVSDYLWSGELYYHIRARHDGSFADLRIDPPQRLFPFVRRQRISFGGQSDQAYQIWLPPDDLQKFIAADPDETFREGGDIIKMKVTSGDHLLVDRFTYNFRRPKRGEIIVFKTRGIEKLDRELGQEQLYIKRLVALGGERVRISDDQRLIINDRKLDASSPGFENIYSFATPPRPNQYFGHANQAVADRWSFYSPLSPLFPDEDKEFVVRPRHYLAMGDNTMNSRDSRDWGDLPQHNVIGKCWFVYWPISPRFGWGYW